MSGNPYSVNGAVYAISEELLRDSPDVRRDKDLARVRLFSREEALGLLSVIKAGGPPASAASSEEKARWELAVNQTEIRYRGLQG